MTNFFKSIGPWLVLLFVFGALGCEEHPNPLVGEERPFTLFGYLNPRSSTQIVRVIPIRDVIDVSEVEIDAQVTSIDLDTGEQKVWRDSLITFEDGEIGHVFVSGFRAAYGHAYQLEVLRSDGARSSAEVTVPPDISFVPGQEMQPALFPYLLEVEDRPNLVQAEVQYVPTAQQPLMNPILYPVDVSYRGMENRTAGGWEIVIDLTEDFKAIQEAFDAVCLTTEFVRLRTMEFVMFIGDESWVPPGNVFDPETLVQPDVFSNVENGFGFFGAGYPIRTAVRPSSLAKNNAGFNEVEPCFEVPPDHPSCRLIPTCFDE